jgi:class 3 adenylate cyclase
MPHDVFISYSSIDKAIADAVVAGLELKGVRCWVAPRDLIPGVAWGKGICEAIENSKVIVVILSENSNHSNQVARELERAVANKVVVVPFRIQDVVPTGAIAYFISSEHWLDAITPPIENHIDKLRNVLQHFIGAQISPHVDSNHLGTREIKATSAPLPNPPQIQSEGYERRIVTILFADIANYSSLSETLDPEELLAIMHKAYPCLIEPIQVYDGMVVQVMGDGVLAYFGTPIAKEDDPERAILAGLEIINRIEIYAGQLQEVTGLKKFNVRIGINTGLVVVGDLNPDKHLEYIALGDAVNLAARLQQIAPPDGLLISHETFRHIQGLFDVIPQTPITVKGRQQITQTYLVKQIRPFQQRRRLRGISGVETPMVGREPEMAALQNYYQDAIIGAETALILIHGDAGIGKTRLSKAFVDWVSLQPAPPAIMSGRAIPSTQSVPYGILRNLFAKTFDILETDSSTQALTKFRQGTQNRLDEEQSDLVGQLIGFDFRSSPAVQRHFW